MPLTDQIKNLTRKLVEDKPDEAALGRMVHKGKITRLHFKDDGIIPNHPRWPLLLYRRAVTLAHGYDPAASIDALFSANGWGRSWRDRIWLSSLPFANTRGSRRRERSCHRGVWGHQRKAHHGAGGRYRNPSGRYRPSPDRGKQGFPDRRRLPG